MPRHARDNDAAEELRAHLRSELSGRALDRAEELLDALCERRGEDDPPEFPDNPKTGANDARLAMDEHPGTSRGVQAFRIALRRVEPVVGEILAADSAAAVFREGLRRLGVDSARLPDAGLPDAFAAHARARRLSDRNAGNTSSLLHSRSVASGDFARAFPDAARIRSV